MNEASNTSTFRNSSVSPLSTQKDKGKVLIPRKVGLKKDVNVKSERLASVQPISSDQFKEILNQRRALIISNK